MKEQNILNQQVEEEITNTKALSLHFNLQKTLQPRHFIQHDLVLPIWMSQTQLLQEPLCNLISRLTLRGSTPSYNPLYLYLSANVRHTNVPLAPSSHPADSDTFTFVAECVAPKSGPSPKTCQLTISESSISSSPQATALVY